MDLLLTDIEIFMLANLIENFEFKNVLRNVYYVWKYQVDKKIAL